MYEFHINTIIEYIILGVITALIVITIYKIYQKHCLRYLNEPMENTKGHDSINNLSTEPDINPEKQYACTRCDITNTYTREFYEDNKQPCPKEYKKYTDKDLQKYRNKFFGFREQIWKGSNVEGPDLVDKMNEQIINNNGEAIGDEFKDETIGDIFDYMTNNYNKKN